MKENEKNFWNRTVKEVLVVAWKSRIKIFILILFLFSVYLGIFSNTFREYFLFDRYGKFQWIGVSAIFAGFGLYINSILKKEEIRANILSKNDLELLKDFRENVAGFSSLTLKYSSILNEIYMYSIENHVSEIYFKSISNGTEKTADQKYLNKKINEMNKIYFDIKNLQIKVYLGLTISFSDVAENVDHSLKEVDSLLEGAVEMLNIPSAPSDIQKKYREIVRANDVLIFLARSYIVIVMDSKVSSFNSKIIQDGQSDFLNR